MNNDLLFARPRLVASRCLGFGACRWDGEASGDDFVERLKAHADFVTPCPEVDIGLGVPRDPVRVVLADGGPRLCQPSTGRDLTNEMREFAECFCSSVGDVDGFILKSRSPSCGVKGVNLYPSESAEAPRGKGSGLFAAAVLARFVDVAVEDEGRLEKSKVRERFLERTFASASLRRAVKGGHTCRLVEFHGSCRTALLARSRSITVLLDRLIAGARGRAPADVAAEYAPLFRRAMSRPARAISRHGAGTSADSTFRPYPVALMDLTGGGAGAGKRRGT